MDGTGDVLDVLLAHVLGAEGELADDLFVDRGRHADAAVRRDRFQPYRDVDGIAHQIVAAFHDVAKIDADTQHELVVLVGRGVGRAHRLLDLERGAHRLDRAHELREHAVARQLEDTAAVMLHDRLGRGHAGAEQVERMLLVARGHGAEPDDVDGNDRGQAPDQSGFIHGDRLADGCAADHRTSLRRGPCSAMTQTMQSETPRYWEDYQVGMKYPLGSTSFTADEIVDVRPPVRSPELPRRCRGGQAIDVRRPDRLGLAYRRQADAAVRRQLYRQAYRAGLARRSTSCAG